jgi:hypothetical protein
MSNEKVNAVNCICGEPHMSLDVFKENGTWIILCHTCDRLEYSSGSRDRAVTKWNDNIDKEHNQIDPHVTLKGEMYDGMQRWIHNVVARWYKEYGTPMNEEEIEDLISLFVLQLEDKNNSL